MVKGGPKTMNMLDLAREIKNGPEPVTTHTCSHKPGLGIAAFVIKDAERPCLTAG